MAERASCWEGEGTILKSKVSRFELDALDVHRSYLLCLCRVLWDPETVPNLTTLRNLRVSERGAAPPTNITAEEKRPIGE